MPQIVLVSIPAGARSLETIAESTGSKLPGTGEYSILERVRLAERWDGLTLEGWTSAAEGSGVPTRGVMYRLSDQEILVLTLICLPQFQEVTNAAFEAVHDSLLPFDEEEQLESRRNRLAYEAEDPAFLRS